MNDDIDRRFDTIGELGYVPLSLDPTRRRRTIEDCRLENAHHQLHGLQVFRPTDRQELDDTIPAPTSDPYAR